MVLTITATCGQTIVSNNFNQWLIYQGTHAFRPKWDLQLETHFRRHEFINGWQQILLRSGFQRTLPRRFSVYFGYTFFRAYPWGDYKIPAITNENRLHQQVGYRHQWGRSDWNHRLRFEERWIWDRGQVRYQHRLRQFTKITLPFARKSPWYWGLSNEIWFNVPPNVVPYALDQNRTVATIGKRVSERNRIEFGYMYQPRWQRNGVVLESNHTLVMYILSNARLRNFRE